MNDKAKRARFQALARHDHIKTARQFAEEHEQPYLPLINDCLTDVKKFNAEAMRAKRAAKKIGFTGVLNPEDRAAAFRRIRLALEGPSEGKDSGQAGSAA